MSKNEAAVRIVGMVCVTVVAVQFYKFLSGRR